MASSIPAVEYLHRSRIQVARSGAAHSGSPGSAGAGGGGEHGSEEAGDGSAPNPEEPSLRLPSRVVYLKACRRPAMPLKPLPQVLFGLDRRLLELKHRHVSDKEVIPIAIALRDGTARTIGVDASHCGVSDWAVAALCDGLLCNRVVRALDLGHNQSGPRG